MPAIANTVPTSAIIKRFTSSSIRNRASPQLSLRTPLIQNLPEPNAQKQEKVPLPTTIPIRI
jgi:hypothetical protein